MRLGKFDRGKRSFRNRATRPLFDVLESRQLLTSYSNINLDMGSFTSPTARNSVGVPVISFNSARGYGWKQTAGITAVDRGGANALTRDYQRGQSGELLVNLVPGRYSVTTNVGDQNQAHSAMYLVAEGNFLASNLKTMPGEFVQSSATVDITDGQLNLSVFALDSSGFALDGVQIRRLGSAVDAPPVTTPTPTPTPTPTASAGPDQTASEGSSVSFIGSTTGFGTASYAWDFGDGSAPSDTLNSRHVYQDNGAYTATLTVSNGQSVIRSSARVAVTNVAPTAAITGWPEAPTTSSRQPISLGSVVTDPSPVDTRVGFSDAWSVLKDGEKFASDTGPTFTFTPGSAGTYVVTLTATDKDGGGGVPVSQSIVVTGSSTFPGALGVVRLTPGWATFGEALPEGEAWGNLQLGGLTTQTDVKTSWPDGSIRFAIVSASVSSTDYYPIWAATKSAAATVNPAIPTASVQLNIGGKLYTAALPATESSDRWLDGSLVTEWRDTVTPVDPTGGAHPFLRVLFDTRVYADGKSRLDVTVENDLDIAGATAVTYDAKIVAGGQTLFSQDAVNHSYLTRWRKVFDLGLTESQVTHDFESFYAAGALPRFSDSITNQSYFTDGSTFNILGRGGNSYDYMGATGGRPELAPYPDWTARYLVDQTADQSSFVMANGDLAGSWPVHVRQVDGSLVSIDQRPNFWIDSRGYDKPAGDLSKTGPLSPDLSHVPSLAYVPYLATGDRYYADEMKFWGDYSLITSYPASLDGGGRGGDLGIVGVGQVRARAWALRNLVDAAAYLPDADPMKDYLEAKVQNNLNYYDQYAQTHVTPLGTVLESGDSRGGTNNILMSQWQNNYLAWSLDHARQQGFQGGQLLANRITAFQLKLFNSGSDYPREYGAPYYPIVGTVAADGTPQYFTSMSQVFHATFDNPDGTVGEPVSFAGYYGVDAQLSLRIAIAQGMAGAQEAYDWLIPQIATDVNNRAGWAIVVKKKS